MGQLSCQCWIGYIDYFLQPHWCYEIPSLSLFFLSEGKSILWIMGWVQESTHMSKYFDTWTLSDLGGLKTIHHLEPLLWCWCSSNKWEDGQGREENKGTVVDLIQVHLRLNKSLGPGGHLRPRFAWSMPGSWGTRYNLKTPTGVQHTWGSIYHKLFVALMALNNIVFEISVGCRVLKPECQRKERNWEGSPSTPVLVSEQF